MQIPKPKSELEKDRRPPNFTLVPEHVFGYNVMDCRKNVFYSYSGEKVVYPVASMVVAMDKN